MDQLDDVENNSKSTKLGKSLTNLVSLTPELGLLDFGNIIVHKTYPTSDKVKLISVGIDDEGLVQSLLVGRGGLTGVVIGEESTPCSRLILRIIRELDCNDKKCGVYILAQTQANLFNLALAVERANQDCSIRCKLLTITDSPLSTKDVSSGFIISVKLLGAFVDTSILYNEVDEFYKEIVGNLMTIPIEYEFDGTTEKNIILNNHLHKTLSEMFRSTSMHDKLQTLIPIVIFINIQQKFTSYQELMFCKLITDRFKKFPLALTRVYLGNFLHPTEGHYASVTILRIKYARMLELCDAPCRTYGKLAVFKGPRTILKENSSRCIFNILCVTMYHPLLKFQQNLIANFSLEELCVVLYRLFFLFLTGYLLVGWQQVKCLTVNDSSSVNLTPILVNRGRQHPKRKGPRLNIIHSNTLTLSLEFACNALISCEKQLNIIDRERSRGNIGTRIKRACEKINDKLMTNGFEVEFPYLVLKKLSVYLESLLGGVLGTIYGVFFENLANSIGEVPEHILLKASDWLDALVYGKKALEWFAKNDDLLYTMIRPIAACASAIGESVAAGNADWILAFGIGVQAAEYAAQETRQAGAQFPDPGAHAVGIWMRALIEGVKLKQKNHGL